MSVAYILTGSGVALTAICIAGTAGWHRLVDFHDRHTDRPGVRPIRPRRTPVAAITARPHHAYVDEHLGPLDLGPLEPAHIHDQLIGAEL